MDVWMYVCSMYVRRMDACMHAWMDGWMYVCMYVCMYVYVCMCRVYYIDTISGDASIDI
jgi:hypothetical protein